ncbi:MAG TPA: hydroxyisourate hydrolase [Candidatus Nitrosotenuis sp.]|jgi:5-hydroxyisourate hydrolase|nr:hydroxyisourate hydrolase [Candidatus Nitrosotenuis sp.]
MRSISTHVLDTSRGRPAAGIEVTLDRQVPGGWQELARGRTDQDGRIQDLLPGGLEAGVYRLTFHTGPYFQGEGFYPEIKVQVHIKDPDQHYHVPLLLSPFGYSTYRGS